MTILSDLRQDLALVQKLFASMDSRQLVREALGMLCLAILFLNFYVLIWIF